MIVNILGSGSGLPDPTRNHSCLLLQSTKANLLLDCGEPVARTYAGYNFHPDHLDGIVITHFHPDHAAGIYMMLQLLHITKRKNELYIFLPEREDDFLHSLEMFYLFPDKLPFELIIKNINQVSEQFKFVQVYENDHLKQYRKFVQKHNLPNTLKSYSILLQGNEQKLLYTSDISNIPKLISLAGSADIIIVDALHPPASQILPLLESDSTIILTHGIGSELENHLKTRIYQNVMKADDYQEIIF